jgi:hypothetical protein
MSGGEVRKRCVFFLGGYEPITPARQHERFVRELTRFSGTWNVTTSVSDMSVSGDGAIALWRVDTRGPNWSVETEYRSLLWGDLVEADFGRSDRVRVPRAFGAFADFIFSGTAWRYFAVNWRYGLFFSYPLLIVASFIAAAVTMALLAVRLGLPMPLLFAPLVAILVFCVLLVVPGRFLMLPYMFDDWIFAQELVHRTRPGLDARLQAFAEEIARRRRQGGYDEFIFMAHSLGCALKLDVADRALRIEAAGPPANPAFNMLSAGSSLLKIALHPAGLWLKDAVARVSQHKAVFWVDFESMVDIISFYKAHPTRALNLPDTGQPMIKRVHVRDMLQRDTYKRFRGNFFRLHRQLVMGNDKRYFYDYFMICCGPFGFPTRLRDPDLMTAAFAADGSLLADAGQQKATGT